MQKRRLLKTHCATTTTSSSTVIPVVVMCQFQRKLYYRKCSVGQQCWVCKSTRSQDPTFIKHELHCVFVWLAG